MMRSASSRKFGLGLLLAVLFYASRAVQANEWPHSTPEAQGVSSQEFVTILKGWKEERLPLHSLLVIRDGTVVHETYAYPFRPNGLHDIASCTKTVTGLLVGIAIEQGKIVGTDATLVDLFSNRQIARLDDRKRAMKLHDLLTMRSGLASFDDGLTLFQMLQKPDWVQFGLDLGMMRSPGERFQYLSVNSHLICAAIQGSVGMPTAEFARRELFEAIGIKEFAWPVDPQGMVHGWGDLRLRTTDMARLGLLLLNDGVWEQKEIVSPDWLKLTTQAYGTTNWAEYPGYGYQCWIGNGRFAAVGRGGQRIVVVPDRKMIVVTTAGANKKQEAAIDQLCRNLVASVDPAIKIVPANPEAFEQVQKYQRALLVPPLAIEVPDRPEIVKQVGGSSYQFAPNPFVEKLRIDFSKDKEALFELHFVPLQRLAPLVLPVGLDAVPRFGPGRYGEPAAATGAWDGPIFTIDFDEVGNINHWQIRLSFEGDEVQLTMNDSTGISTIRAKGKR